MLIRRCHHRSRRCDPADTPADQERGCRSSVPDPAPSHVLGVASPRSAADARGRRCRARDGGTEAGAGGLARPAEAAELGQGPTGALLSFTSASDADDANSRKDDLTCLCLTRYPQCDILPTTRARRDTTTSPRFAAPPFGNVEPALPPDRIRAHGGRHDAVPCRPSAARQRAAPSRPSTALAALDRPAFPSRFAVLRVRAGGERPSDRFREPLYVPSTPVDPSPLSLNVLVGRPKASRSPLVRLCQEPHLQGHQVDPAETALRHRLGTHLSPTQAFAPASSPSVAPRPRDRRHVDRNRSSPKPREAWWVGVFGAAAFVLTSHEGSP